MTEAVATPSSGPDIGRVAKLTAAFSARHWIWLLSLGVPLVLVPEAASQWVIGLAPILAAIKAVGIAGSTLRGAITASVTLVPSAAMVSLVAHRVAADFSGDHTPRIFAGLDRAIAVLPAKLASDVGIRIGEILLVIPGIILSVVWAVTGPVAALEGLGPIESLSRSADLTRNRRGAIFLLALIYFAIGVVLGLGMLAVIRGGTAHLFSLASLSKFSTAQYAAIYLFEMPYDLVRYVGVAVLYHVLVGVGRGTRSLTLAAVFD